MRTEVILLALLVILGNTKKPMGMNITKLTDFHGCAIKPMDIAFIIDSSWDIYPPDFKYEVDSIYEHVGMFKIGPQNVRIAAVSFSNTVNTDTAFGFDKYNDREEVHNAILQIVYNPGLARSPNTAMAIEYARKQFFVNPRPFSKQIAIVITSSKPNDFEKTNEEASLLKKQGVEIIVLGVDIGISVKELKALVSRSDLFFTLRSYHDNDYFVKFAVKVCSWCNAQAIDFNFVFDPAQMGKRGIKKTIRFIKNILNSKKYEDGQISAGIITDQATRAVPINRDTNPQDILALFDIHKTTDMVSLIGELRNDAFPSNNGSRVNARKIAVLFLKGKLRNPQEIISELELVNKEGIEIFVIDIGGMNDQISRQKIYEFWLDTKPRKWWTKKTAQYVTRNICSIIFLPKGYDIY